MDLSQINNAEGRTQFGEFGPLSEDGGGLRWRLRKSRGDLFQSLH